MSRKIDTPRRTDRQEDTPEFLHLLLENAMSCSIAVATDDYPLIHSTFFIYDKENDEVIFHFSKYGFGGQEIQNGKKISISVYKYGKLYTAEKAVDFGCEYQSVIIYGKVRVVENEGEKMAAMKTFFDRFFKHIPASSYKDFTITETNPINVVKVKIEKWYGKQHLVPQKAFESFYAPFKPTI